MRDMLPTVQMLLSFEAVIETGGFARAAQRLNLTPAAVSYQIKGLERLFGAPLFERHADRISPTRLAHDLTGSSGDILQRLREFRDRGMAISHQNMTVRLLVTEALASVWLLPRMADLIAHFPDRNFEVVSWLGGNWPFQLGAKERGVHIALRWARSEDLLDGPHVRRLAPDKAIPVCTADYKARLGSLDSIDGWRNATLICPLNWPDIWERYGEAAFGGKINAPRLFLQNSALCIQAAAGGLGVAIAHQPLVTNDLESGQLVAAHRFTLPLSETYFAVNINESDTALFDRFGQWCSRNMGGEDRQF
jgi:LysR family transcriptional regulator, glycine cleavage system transcriptional activator